MVIAGSHDTDLAKELIYTVLKDKMNVRRNVTEIWWDLSIPLNILGYQDKQRSFFGWINLVLKIILVLFTNPKNPHLLILNADTTNQHTVEYWSKFLEPKYLVVLNKSSNTNLIDELVFKTSLNDGKIIVPIELVASFEVFNQLKNNELFTYGATKGVDLELKLTKDKVTIKFESKELHLKKKLWWTYSKSITGALFSIAALEDISLTDAAFSSLKFTFPTKVMTRIKANLKM